MNEAHAKRLHERDPRLGRNAGRSCLAATGRTSRRRNTAGRNR